MATNIARPSQFATFDNFKYSGQASNGAAEDEDGDDDLGAGLHRQSSPLVTGLGDGLPDPPDHSSDEEDDEDQIGLSKSLPDSTNDAHDFNPADEIINIPGPSLHGPSEAEAALLNNFINPRAASEIAPRAATAPLRTLRPRKANKGLQRIGLYEGGGTQRRFVSDPIRTFDVPESPEREIVPRHIAKAPAVVPEEMDWRMTDTLQAATSKKRRLEPTNNPGLASKKLRLEPTNKPGRAAELDGVVGQVLADPKILQQSATSSSVPRMVDEAPKRGRPRKTGPKKAEVSGAVETLKGVRVQEQPPDDGKGQRSFENTGDSGSSAAFEYAKVAHQSSSPRKRGRPRKPLALGDNHAEKPVGVEPSEAPRSPLRQRGRPRKSKTNGDSGPEQRVEEPTISQSDEVTRAGRELTSASVGQAVNSAQHGEASHAQMVSADYQNDENSTANADLQQIPDNGVNSGQGQTLQSEAHRKPSEEQPPTEDVEVATANREIQDTDPDKCVRAAFKLVKRIGKKTIRGHMILCTMPTIQTAVTRKLADACSDAHQLMSRRDVVAGVEGEPTGDQSELKKKVDQALEKALRVVSKPQTWNQDEKRVQDIFVHVIPKLIKLLKDVLAHYKNITLGNLPDERIEVLHTLMKAIVQVGSKSVHNKTRLTIEFPVKSIVRDIHRMISIAYTYTNERLSARDAQRKAEEDRQATEQERQRAAAAKARRQEERRQRGEGERQRELEEGVIAKWKKRWNDLHLERTRAELTGRSSLHPSSKYEHLRLVPLDSLDEDVVEIDANGELIERVEMFTQRQNPPPGQRRRYLAQDWTWDQLHALAKGLQEFAGPRVYERIFWAHCQPGKNLYKFNVSEIVDQAMWLRQEFLEEAQLEVKEAEAWIVQVTDPRVPPDVSEL